MKDARFSISIDIKATAERVFDVMCDVTRWSEWTPSVTSIKRLDSGPFVVGSRAVIRQPKFPPALWTISAIEPGRSFTWFNRAPGIRVFAHHLVEPTTTGSRATLSLRYEGLFGEVLAWLADDITRRYLFMEAGGLKGRSENPAYASQQSTVGGSEFSVTSP